MVRDPADGTVTAVSESIPDGLQLTAERVLPSSDSLGKMGTESVWKSGTSASVNGAVGATAEARGLAIGKGSDDGFHGTGSDKDRPNAGGAEVFRGELLKFERVNAHLANERTWLAWVRTALSVIGVALSLLSLADDFSSTSMNSLALALGVAFVLCTLFTYVTGWLRYTKVKEVLSRQATDVKRNFGRFGLSYQARFLAIALLLTVPLYIAGGINIVVEA